MKTKRRIVVTILAIIGIWVAAIAAHYVGIAWHRSKLTVKWEKALAQEYRESKTQAEERFYALLEYYGKNMKCSKRIWFGPAISRTMIRPGGTGL